MSNWTHHSNSAAHAADVFSFVYQSTEWLISLFPIVNTLQTTNIAQIRFFGAAHGLLRGVKKFAPKVIKPHDVAEKAIHL